MVVKVSTGITVSQLKGILELLAKSGIYEAVFYVDGREVFTRAMNPAHTVLVEISGTWYADFKSESGYIVLKHVEALLRGIARKRDWLSLEVVDNTVRVEDFEAGEFYRNVEELKKAGYTPLQEIPGIDMILEKAKAMVEVDRGDMLRWFVSRVERFEGDIFVGVKTNEPYIGFSAGDIPFETFIFKDFTNIKWESDVATIVRADMLLTTLPYTWFRSRGAPRVSINIVHAGPLVVTYRVDELNVRVAIAPVEMDPKELEELVGNLLRESPTSEREPPNTEVKITVPIDLLARFVDIFREFGFSMVLEEGRPLLYGLSSDKTTAYIADVSAEYTRAPRIPKAGFYSEHPALENIDIYTYLTDKVVINIDSDGKVYLWTMDVEASLDEDVFKDYQAIMNKLKHIAYERHAFNYKTRVRDLRRIIDSAVERLRVKAELARATLYRPCIVISSNGNVYGYEERVGIVYVETLKGYTVERDRYTAVMVEGLKLILSPLDPSASIWIYLWEEGKPGAVPLVLHSEPYGGVELWAAIAPLLVEDKLLVEAGVISRPPPPPARIEEVVEKLRDAVSEAREIADTAMDADNKAVAAITVLEAAEEPPEAAEARAREATKTIEGVLAEIGRARKVLEDIIKFVEEQPEDVRRNALVTSYTASARSYLEELERLAKRLEERRARIEELLKTYKQRYEEKRKPPAPPAPPPPAYPREPPEKPWEVEYWERQLKLNVLGWRQETPPGFRFPVWVLWVVDEGTGEVVRAIMGYPYTEQYRYALTRIVNKAGYTVTVLTFREDREAVEARVPPQPEVSMVAEEALRAVREAVEAKPDIRAAREEAVRLLAAKPFSWSEFRSEIKRFYERIPVWEKAVEDRNALALYSYLSTFRDRMRSWLERLARVEPEIHSSYEEVEKAKPKLPPPKLTREEVEKLWAVWSETLSRHGIDPYRYKEDFDEIVAIAPSFKEASVMIEQELRNIIADWELERMMYRVQPPAVQLNWKQIGWGVAFIKSRLLFLDMEAEKRNTIGCYIVLREILDATYKLLDALRHNPDVKRFRDVTGLD